HGRIPVPAPATIALLKGVPVYDSGIQQELVTPTGAALLRGLVRSFGSMPPMAIEKVGYGVGTYDLPDRPNLLRILVGEDREDARSETVLVLEANLDDTNPEWLGYLMDRLFEAGALDVVFLPAHMKKNRPGTLLQVIARPDQRDVLSSILKYTFQGEHNPWGAFSL
ncbi:MAG: LarC family nickel insertion protein, partial [Deltaproteobacteria bacterium]|nr:LarC family nickel insertion protein [Deltaproteobacteria bacterium]